jgi:NAD(P)-dependent dehydrogenase (short-subunit alcohol dehydrogenase family)
MNPELKNAMNIEDKNVMVTGADRELGGALVEEALRRGAKKVFAVAGVTLRHPDKRVTPLALDVTNAAQVQRAAGGVDTLDVLINDVGIGFHDDLSKPEVIEQHLAVNLFGPLNMTRAFLPHLRRSEGAIINNLSLASFASVPMLPSYSISKAAVFSLTQSLRALLTGEGVAVHAVFLGPLDTDMNRGLDIPKASPESAAAGIFDGLSKGEEDIFPDPASQSIAEAWRAGVAKALERQFAVFAPH